MLAHSFLMESSSKLLVTRTGIKARTSSISGLWFPWPIYMLLFFLNENWPWHIGLRWAIVAFWATCLKSPEKIYKGLKIDIFFCISKIPDWELIKKRCPTGKQWSRLGTSGNCLAWSGYKQDWRQLHTVIIMIDQSLIHHRFKARLSIQTNAKSALSCLILQFVLFVNKNSATK